MKELMRVKDYFENKNIKINHYVTGITDNSNDCNKNYIFVAKKGYTYDGFDFIKDAIKKGAKTIVSDNEEVLSLKYKGVNLIYCLNSQIELSKLLKKHYQKEKMNIKIIGVTGTNGKTTICSLVYYYLSFIKEKVMYIGTNGIYLNDISKTNSDKIFKTNNTTIDIVSFYKCLNYCAKNNYKYLVMEVSSQGIKEGRVKFIDFDVGLISNITHDHLDYHKTFDDLFYTKISFLKCCKKVIINANCDRFNEIIKALDRFDYITYGITSNNQKLIDYYANNLELSLHDSSFNCYILKNELNYYIYTKLLGEFNISNILGMIAIIDNIIDNNIENNKLIFSKMQLFLSQKIKVKGRLEIIYSSCGIYVVDFAHSPDSIFKVLTFLKSIINNNKLIVVLGMGGNRDNSKRAIVGDIVSKLADIFIITSDNPRDEDNDLIVYDIVKGINSINMEKVLIINDRFEAIKKSISFASKDDVVAILGKGNENIQIIKNERNKFNDKEVVINLLKENNVTYYE